MKRLVFTSGKVYYELAAKRAELGKQEEIAIVRVEQVCSMRSATHEHLCWFRHDLDPLLLTSGNRTNSWPTRRLITH